MLSFPQLLTNLTGKVRYRQPIWWRRDSLVHNAFMLWKLIFWTPHGPRLENSVHIKEGKVTYKYHTWEALFFAIEEMILHPKFALPFKIHIPLLRTPLGFSISASPYLFAIAFDVTQHAGSATNPSLSITRGTGSSNYVGITIVGPLGASRSCSGVTWAGSSMTQCANVA